MRFCSTSKIPRSNSRSCVYLLSTRYFTLPIVFIVKYVRYKPTGKPLRSRTARIGNKYRPFGRERFLALPYGMKTRQSATRLRIFVVECSMLGNRKFPSDISNVFYSHKGRRRRRLMYSDHISSTRSLRINRSASIVFEADLVCIYDVFELFSYIILQYRG